MLSSRVGAWAAVVILVTGCSLLDRLTGGGDDGAVGPDAAGSASATPRGSGSVGASAAPAESGAPPASASAAAVARPLPCPEEMALIDDQFCIDRWEATTLNEDGTDHSPYHAVGPKRVRAVSQPGVVPQAYISFEEAEAACRRADKRICATRQWLDACAGLGKNRRLFPYGPRATAGVCNVSRPIHPSSLVHGQRKTDAYSLNDPRLNQLDNTVARTGSFAGCVTPEGVSDLQGNLLEWTRGDQPLLMGGYYLDAKQHGPGCSYVTDGHGPQYHDFTTGFRCCKKPDPKLLGAHVAQKKEAARRAAARPSRDPPRRGRSPRP